MSKSAKEITIIILGFLLKIIDAIFNQKKYVKGYRKKDGTYIKGHYRKKRKRF